MHSQSVVDQAHKSYDLSKTKGAREMAEKMIASELNSRLSAGNKSRKPEVKTA